MTKESNIFKDEAMNESARQLIGMIRDICEWHEATFPNATEETQQSKFTEETHEAELECIDMFEFLAFPTDEYMFEIADCFISAVGMYRFNEKKANLMLNRLWKDMPYLAFIRLPTFVKRKMEINKKRTWTMDKNGVYRHKEQNR